MKPVKARIVVSCVTRHDRQYFTAAIEDDKGVALIEFPPLDLPEGSVCIIGPVYVVPGLSSKQDVVLHTGIDPAFLDVGPDTGGGG